MNQNKSKKRDKVRKKIFLAKNPKNEIAKNSFFNYWSQNTHPKKDLSQVPPIILAAGYNAYLGIYFF